MYFNIFLPRPHTQRAQKEKGLRLQLARENSSFRSADVYVYMYIHAYHGRVRNFYSAVRITTFALTSFLNR